MGWVSQATKKVTNAVTPVVKPITKAVTDVVAPVSKAVTAVTSPIEKAIVAPVSKAATELVQNPAKAVTNVLQPVEKTVTAGVADVSKGATDLLQPVEKVVTSIASDPKALTAIALAVAAPYAAAQLLPYLSAFGAYAPIAAQAITGITVQVAQGVPIEKATENALINVAMSGASSEVQRQIGSVVKNANVANTISSTVVSGLATATKGGSQADIEKAMTAGLVGSTASTLYGEALGVSPATSSGAKVVANAANQAVMGATPEQIATSAIGQIGANVVKDAIKTPPVAPAVNETAAEKARLENKNATLAAAPVSVVSGNDVGLSPEQISTRIDNIIADSPGVQVAGALPLAEMSASALLQQPERLIQLVKEAANDPNYKVLLPALERNLGQFGLTIAEVASRLNPAFLAAQLATFSPNAGDPNEDAKMAQIFKDYGLKLPSAVTPIETTPIQSTPVTGLDITKENESQA